MNTYFKLLKEKQLKVKIHQSSVLRLQGKWSTAEMTCLAWVIGEKRVY